jgi:copper(I)-binding protein
MHRRFAWMLAAVALLAQGALAQVRVEDAWVRGTVAGQRATGAFMRLVASGDVTLVAIASPVATSAEIHEMKHEQGVMKMRAVERLAVRSGESVTLGPGSYHVMLMGLKQTINAGDRIPLTLTFEDAKGVRSSVDVMAPARALGAAADRKH